MNLIILRPRLAADRPERPRAKRPAPYPIPRRDMLAYATVAEILG